MQNLRIFLVLLLNFFLPAATRSPRRFIVRFTVFFLTTLAFAAQAQVIAPTTGSGATSSPAATPASGNSTQPGRGATLPSNVNTSNLPASVQQQIKNATTNGRTATPANNSGNGTNGQTQGRSGSVTSSKNEEGIDTAQQADQSALKASLDNAAQREAAERRRKLFGYSLFNDPNLAATFQPNINVATPRNYIVGPGDELTIRMYGYSEGDFTQKVSPEGYVYIANQTGIGPIFVSGSSIEKVKERLIGRLSSKFVGLRNSSYGPQNTYLDVSLGSIRSIRVTVSGEALRPGTYTLSSLSTAMNAIYQAGGPSDIGSMRKVQLIRNNKIIANLDLYDYLLTGIQQNDYRLQDNDNIRFTTYVERVEITGTVKRSNIFEMLPGETMDRLLFYSGGFTANAYKNRLKVTRLTDRELKVIDVTTPEFKTFVMEDGDVVTVERLLDRFENKVTIDGAVYRPGEYSLNNNTSLKQLIASADGIRGDAFTGRINIVRTREDLAIENLTVNLAAIMAGTDPDVPLQREDQVIIPSRFDLAQQATIAVGGDVNRPNPSLPYMANMTLDDAIIKSGGFLESAAAGQVEVVRRKKDADPHSPTAQIADIFHFNVNRDLTLSNDENKNFVLEPFDQIVVRRSPNYLVQTYANVEGEVIMPGSYPILRKDQKISDLVTQSGGLTPYAYVEGATLIRPVKLSEDELNRRQRAIEEVADNANKSAVETETITPNTNESIGINLKKILAKPGSSEDILLQEGDVLRIPKLLETVRIQGEVQLPNTVKFRSGQTFQDYISQTGGFTSKSQRRRSFIIYANGSVDRTRKFMFFNVYPRVEPGSEIVVPRRTAVPLTPQQVLSSTAGTISSLLSVIGLIIALSRVGN